MLSLRLLIIIGLIFVNFWVLGQASSLTVKISRDTLSIDEVLEVEFCLENMEGRFVPPDFEGFRVVSGPNTLSSMTIIKGITHQKKSYSYMLKPLEKGDLTIGMAKLIQNNRNIETDIKNIFVTEEKYQPYNQKKESLYRMDREESYDTKRKKRPIKRI